MNSKKFASKFMLSETIGLLLGMPVASAYALLLIHIEEHQVNPVISFIGIMGVIIVAFIALPMNIFILSPIKKRMLQFQNSKITTVEGTQLYLSLVKLPFKQGGLICARICLGTIIVCSYMAFGLKIDVIQSLIAICLAFYGAYIAGLVAYIFVYQIIKAPAAILVEKKFIVNEKQRQKKFFGNSLISRIIMFLLIPIIFTHVSLVLTTLASYLKNIPYELLFNKICGVVIINLITLLILVLFMIFNLRSPMVTLEKSLSGFSSSSNDISTHIKTDLFDEFAYISYLINNAISIFRSILVQVRVNGTKLTEATQNLSVSTKEISATSHEQAAAVKEIVSTMEDSDTLSRAIALKIAEVTKVAHATKTAVDRGYKLITESLSQMAEIKTANFGTISGIQQLGDKIGNISDIIKIINNIADQTKIIAFNAELEASSAGEAGKNFQIVASEIRRLADNTVASTKEIKSKILEMQHSSDRLISASKAGTVKINKGWEVSNNVQKIFDDILSSAEISASQASAIETSIKLQVSSFEQILLTLKQISEGINNFVESTRSTTRNSLNLKTMADDLEKMVVIFKV